MPPGAFPDASRRPPGGLPEASRTPGASQRPPGAFPEASSSPTSTSDVGTFFRVCQMYERAFSMDIDDLYSLLQLRPSGCLRLLA